MAFTQCFRTEIVDSKANASQMKARNASVLIGRRSFSVPFQTAQVSTVRRCVAYLRLVRTARSMGMTCRMKAAKDSSME
jgi:hypothetical protein